MNDYQLTSFQSVSGAREVSQHQAVLQEGPTNSPNFRIHGWTFHVRGVDMRLSMHVNDPPSVKKAVSSELERIIIGALKQVHRDGSQMTDLVHFYLECAGLDFSFCFNPSGANAVTLGEFFCCFALYIYIVSSFFVMQVLCSNPTVYTSFWKCSLQ